MKNNNKIALLLISLIYLSCIQESLADPREKAGRLISENASLICGIAHPTATYRNGTYWVNSSNSGRIQVSLELNHWNSITQSKGKTNIEFYFDRSGELESIGSSDNGAFLFSNLLAGTLIYIAESDKEFRNNLRTNALTRATWKQLKRNANAKSLLYFILKTQ